MDKVVSSPEEAVADIVNGSTIMFGGFGVAGIPFTLIKALYEKGTKGITAITNSPGGRLEDFDLSVLFRKRQISEVIASYPVYSGKVNAFEELYLKGEVGLELVPQGTFAERIRAGGAGIPGFYTPTGVGTVAEEGKEKRTFGGKEHLLELALRADFALVKAHKADRMGNLTYRMTARNFNPLMATAADITIAEVDEIVEVGELDPESVVTPGIYVNRIIKGEKYDVGFE
ncbi:MAG: CoA transferase subunit A [Dehalococcoidales bacterium]|nr:MAG: CoA transferase subunit A [Dehalococcoidales bacterium]